MADAGQFDTEASRIPAEVRRRIERLRDLLGGEIPSGLSLPIAISTAGELLVLARTPGVEAHARLDRERVPP